MDEDYIRFQAPWYRQTNRTSAAVKVYFCGRQNVIWRASKRHFVSVEAALCHRRNVLSSKSEKATPPALQRERGEQEIGYLIRFVSFNGSRRLSQTSLSVLA